MPKVLIPMADYGNDPTEVAIPFSVFKNANFQVDFATETGQAPQCDSKMLEGISGSLLGANAEAKKAYNDMATNSAAFQKPLSWSDPAFSMAGYDLVFLPGGHEKGVRQLIESKSVQSQLADYFPKTSLNNTQDKKVVAAICHGVQVLAFTPAADSPLQTFPLSPDNRIDKSTTEGSTKTFKSVIHNCKTTGLPGYMESSIYQATRLFMGDYYKTFGACSPNVEDYVKHSLADPKQFDAGPGVLSGKSGQPFIVEDKGYRYVSGRFPPDAELVATRAVEMVKEALGEQ